MYYKHKWDKRYEREYNDRILSEDDLVEVLGLSGNQFQEISTTEGFPKPMLLAPNIRRWSLLRVQRWLYELSQAEST